MNFILLILVLAKLYNSQNVTENNSKYKCGIRKVANEPGVNILSEQGAWPWTVAVRTIQDENINIISGTIISEYHVLTFKVVDLNYQKIHIISGRNDIQDDNAIGLRVIKVIDHPDPNVMLSILEIDQPFKFSNIHLPICLPDSNDPSIIFNKTLILTGWGDTSSLINEKDLLESKFDVVNSLNQSECSGQEEDYFCSIDTQNSCFYDFGSALMASINNTWYLYGVSLNESQGFFCDNSDPVLHIMIPKYLDWIKSSMVINKTEPVSIKLQRDYECGKPYINPSARVINGKPSVPNSWPWTVVLWRQELGSLKFICGGSILSNRYILTAAHCVDFEQSLRYYISVETIKLSYSYNYKKLYFVKRVFKHKNYDPLSLYNDIAILELMKPIRLTRKVMKVCLPLTNDVTPLFNKTVYVAGWGMTGNSPVSDHQMQANFKIMNFNNDTFCQHRDGLNYCAIDEMDDMNVCYGDSGSGIYYYMNRQWYVYGIASFVTIKRIDETTFKCNNKEPSFHVMVPNYLDWIQRVMKDKTVYDQYIVDFL